MKAQTLDKLAWILIYGGVAIAIAGGFVGEDSLPLAATCWTVGGVAVGLGVAAILVRARKGSSS